MIPMLYLAQVTKNHLSGSLELQLLAYRNSDNLWRVSHPESLPVNQDLKLNEGLLVLVDCSDNREILKIIEAKDWVLQLVQQYLSNYAITPQFVEKEQARLEKWRQELTSKSQDLTRQLLEIETRREQLQELETSLKGERAKIRSIIEQDEQNRY